MSFDDIMLETEEHMEKTLKVLGNEFRRIRTGRANPSMLDHVHAEVYGVPTPINQVAGISVPEPSQLLIKPWDKNTLAAIERAISTSDLGLTPQNDGEVIRLNIPPLSEERRKQLASSAKEACEKAKVAMRNSRRDGIKHIEALGKEQNIGEDAVKQAAEEVTDLLKGYEAKAEESLKAKTEDILTL